jgi:hypothetical protein
MMNNLDVMDDILILEEKFTTDESIELSPEQIALAAKLSASVKPEERWKTYLDQLAMLGLEEWLSDRVPKLAIKQDWQRSIDYLTVGDFNLMIIRVNEDEDDVALSKSAIDQPSLQPHLYVLVEVLAESGLVRICGCLSQLQLMQHREVEAARISEEDETTYLLPLDWFELDPAQVLLYLRCIHPLALIPKPAVDKVPVHPPIFSTVQSVTSDISRSVKKEVKQAVQELSLLWQPSLQLSSVMRSQSEEDIATIVSELQDKGVEIHPEYIYGCLTEDLMWQDVSLRLHVLKWNLANTILAPKWSLLLILGAAHDKILPPKLKFKIEDTEQNLVYEDIVSESTQSPYLYSQVVGARQEQFNVIIEMPNQLKFRISSISYY